MGEMAEDFETIRYGTEGAVATVTITAPTSPTRRTPGSSTRSTPPSTAPTPTTRCAS